MRQLEAELVLDAHAVLAEGPHWDTNSMRLLWLNITPGEIHWFDPQTGSDSISKVETMVGAAVPRKAGGLILATQNGFVFFDDDHQITPVVDIEADLGRNRMNDGKCDSQGRFWAGTMDMDLQKPLASLYRLDCDNQVETMLSEITISNGLGWSPDNSTMYYIDSMSQCVDAFDYDSLDGSIGNRRSILEIDAEEGLPDGMTIDVDGFLWVAIYGAGRVRRFSPQGVPDMEIKMPSTGVTSCTFGGPDLDDLYITTAAQFLSQEDLRQQPHAGGIFRVRPGPRGLPANRFCG